MLWCAAPHAVAHATPRTPLIADATPALLTIRYNHAGLFMSDDEGVLSTTDVKAKFSNGKPQCIEARYQMKSQFEWDRFIRFMDRYAAEKGLGLEK